MDLASLIIFLLAFGIFFAVLFHFFFKWVEKEDRELERACQEYLKIREEIEAQAPTKQEQ